MSTFLIVLLILVGLVLIIKGGDAFVDAATWMAEKTGIPKLIIGATVVSIATTLPEMIVSAIAASEGKVDMAIGNSTGSATVNVALIMGIAIIAMPNALNRKDYMLKSILMIGQALILTAFAATGKIGILPCILLFAMFAVFMIDNIEDAKKSLRLQGEAANKQIAKEKNEKNTSNKNETAINVLKFILGAVGIVLGSKLLVDNGSELAAILGVPERIIAVSVVAIGTSLPELVTTISAIVKKQNALSVGNVIGANIINMGLVIPMSAIASGKALPVSPQLAKIDLPACLLVSCIAMIPALISKKFRRGQGIVMVIFYCVYIVFTTVIMQ